MKYLVGSLPIILCHIVMPSVLISLLAVALALQSLYPFLFFIDKTLCHIYLFPSLDKLGCRSINIVPFYHLHQKHIKYTLLLYILPFLIPYFIVLKSSLYSFGRYYLWENNQISSQQFHIFWFHSRKSTKTDFKKKKASPKNETIYLFI